MQTAELTERVHQLDAAIVYNFRRYGHRLHRISVGALFIWFGLLKPFGHKTTSSLLAHTVFWGSPEEIVPFLGWWEAAIGLCLVYRPLVRVAFALLVLRLPGILLAFLIYPDICFYHFPLAPTPEGQYLIKDLTLFFATIAIAGSARERSHEHQLH